MSKINTPRRGHPARGEDIASTKCNFKKILAHPPAPTEITLPLMDVSTTDIIPFPTPTTTRDGWIRSCWACGKRFILSWVCGTIRDGREKRCPTCLVDYLHEKEVCDA